MKHIKLFEQFELSPLYEEIKSIMELELSDVEIQGMLDEGLFSWLGSLFSNPRKKRELDKLAEKLVEVRVDMAKSNIEAENIEAFEDELNSKDDYSSRKGGGSHSKTSTTDLKVAQLQKLESDIITQMDLIGEENDKLKIYVNKVKLNSRMQSTEHIMRIADGQIKKVLSKMSMKDKKKDRELTKELQVQMN